ncbi:MAG TPA: prenyltransferase/squalene oxidase repeat-containing protein, partial [Terriglobales bacterium]|nr:prenyltransferase/squalene oxidase repeat-containing protein [Terriglobales bacterium]
RSSQRQQLSAALHWLCQSGTAGGWGMSPGEAPDADTTALAVIALRKFGRDVPRTALDFIRNCQRPNGGFSPYPESSTADHLFKLSAPDTTVAAVQALGTPNPRAEEFLASRVQDWPVPWCRLSSRFHLCAEILGSESGTASWPLMQKVGQLMSYYARESAFEQAAFLRCAFRLQIQRAGTVAAKLKSLQLPDGSWPASAALGPAMPGVVVRHRRHPLILDDKKTLTTTAAVSALAMHESQPGLYFGSDVPRPRRLSTP